MRPKVKELADQLSKLIGPAIMEQKDFSVVGQAISIVTARIAWSAPAGANQNRILKLINATAEEALSALQKEDEQKALLEQGIAKFTDPEAIGSGNGSSKEKEESSEDISEVEDFEPEEA
jgi:hypothetical protein